MKSLWLTYLLCVWASVGCVYSQPYYFTHYQVENGLSNNAVLCSAQDAMGFMWFGTKDGLNRFDGYSFKVFHSDRSEEHTSELQSLMRISYAVFCLKKKKNSKQRKIYTNNT